MAETNETRYHSGDTLSDALRFLCDASYAVLPRDVAHKLGEFEKNFWGGVGWLADKKINWIDEALRGGDRLREEWQRRSQRETQTQTPPPEGMG
ncbi:MAG TPA: hypothetical protein VGB61_10605 [Pyrinomonadaceae bacterium]|jgi:hypothetical protein